MNDRALFFWIRLFFVLVVLSSISDIIADIGHGAHIKHILQESLICIAALGLLLMLFFNTRAQAKHNAKLQQELAVATARSTQASKELVVAKRAFGEEIANQFSDWSFTDSESEIALYTLKGLSAKEIANLRNASEKTVRNQLTNVYRKSGTASKLGFIAWFMEGLL